MYFNFNEINIIIQNLTSPNKQEFLTRLYHLKSNTKDAMLLQSIKTLTNKVMESSDQQFRILYEDVKANHILTTEGYLLPDC